MLVAAGGIKVVDLDASVRSVVAYDLFSYPLAEFIGITLPIIEIALGLLLIIGLLTRPSAALGAVLMVVFIAGIASAWARGLTIDCGCFGDGGPVSENQTKYAQEIARDIGLALAGLYLVIRPRTLFALDNKLQPDRNSQ
ncbi:MauE/DoxX family redox-associated membrane protein [Ornithinimicrobium sp. INDO-MA30-4]|uniref:MauE/DoxX family redox-associated membrane protein n=1 Tax=Ornithinimicrobium sp. INDO-MA30-4 TaxID=2908651 RepID=UPI001F423673|nr:MauE/DoxX family redox-associated membrane protein [Ornithinimicrobium sp. INDO-MA30-4]UJH71020.1 DoxX family membrane protein [Ornithinimicrobium sp. INDO-MA30-4]